MSKSSATTQRKPTVRLGLTFHRTFALNRAAMSDILLLASNATRSSEDSRCLTKDMIRQLTNLGTIYIAAMPRYCFGTGLLDQGSCLSAFGSIVCGSDPLLDQASTQWLMHYHLSAAQGPGPAFWHDLISTRFRPGSSFTRQDIAAQIAEFFEQNEGKPLAERSARSTATVFLGTYLKPEGLGRLRLFWEDEEGWIHAREPEAPSVWAFAYALVDYWHAHYPDRLGINLDTLLSPGGIADLFMIGPNQLDALLRDMQDAGYVNVYRVAPPYQVVLLRQDVEPLLERMYGINHTR